MAADSKRTDLLADVDNLVLSTNSKTLLIDRTGTTFSTVRVDW